MAPLTRDAAKEAEATEAAREATRGALHGAAKWGVAAAMLGGLGYLTSPIYRGLTVQFKIYLQMTGMIIGGAIEADYRMREYEAKVRMHKRRMRDLAAMERFEQEYGGDEDD